MIAPDKRVMVFIDGPNTTFTIKRLGLTMDYRSLIEGLRSFFPGLVGVNFYSALHKKSEGFLKYLASYGYNVVTRTAIKVRDPVTGNEIYKGDMDTILAIDAILKADQYDCILLFSGDGDFTYLVDTLRKRMGKHVIVVSSCVEASKSISSELLAAANKFVELATLVPQEG